MEILGAANKPIHEWSSNSLLSNINTKVETIDIKGVSMERKNIVYKDDIDESINQLIESLTKEGVLR